MTANSRETILAAAKRTAQAHGYNGLNFRDLAVEVGGPKPYTAGSTDEDFDRNMMTFIEAGDVQLAHDQAAALLELAVAIAERGVLIAARIRF